MTTTGAGRFAGKAAIITGASRGIGLAVARRLVDEGAKVCITARNLENLSEAVESLGGAEHAIGIAGAADDAGHQEETVQRTLQAFGRLDVLVNNTGINPYYGKLLNLDPSIGRKIMEVNVLGSLAWTQRAHRSWMEHNGGAVVNISSVAGLKPSEGIGFYGASKAAISHMTMQLAVELGPSVRVNAVAPAVVKTRFATLLFEGREDEVVKDYALKRLGSPEDIAAAVAFLASSDASWITGQTLVVDGGLTLAGGV